MTAMTSFLSTCRAFAIGNSFRVMTSSLVPPKLMIAINVLFVCLCAGHPNWVSSTVKANGGLRRADLTAEARWPREKRLRRIKTETREIRRESQRGLVLYFKLRAPLRLCVKSGLASGLRLAALGPSRLCGRPASSECARCPLKQLFGFDKSARFGQSRPGFRGNLFAEGPPATGPTRLGARRLSWTSPSRVLVRSPHNSNCCFSGEWPEFRHGPVGGAGRCRPASAGV